MEKLLLIAIPDTAGVEQIAGKLRLRTVTVAPENYGKSLGSLAGYAAGTVPVSAETTLPETGLLVMCGLKIPGWTSCWLPCAPLVSAFPTRQSLRQPTRTGTSISWRRSWNGSARQWKNADLRMQMQVTS